MTTARAAADPAEAAEAADLRIRPSSAPPRTLIVTVYGLYSRRHGGWLSVASLIGLLASLGVDEQAVRSAIHRLKRRGILVARRQDGAAGYELSEEARDILREGDERIFRRERATLADGWLLAVFSVPESERNKRHQLRSQLARLGFGTVAPGVWIAPAHLYDATAAMLRRLDLTSYADLLRSDHLAFGELSQKVRQWWNFEQLEPLYRDFIDAHGPVRESLGRRGTDEAGAFAHYVRALTDWRRLPYLDPGLPTELLPADWVGIRAADLFFALHEELEEPARAHVAATLAGQPGQPADG
ncbi:PaaX family transcriptional regulator [Streptomyces sp. NBC_01221]|uniref:PaaX family transcriptional regulator n=1 Tax=Streptomyces sp. NBC_01221 TaxID=2903782 RepID=UPI0022573DF3|nr:PaaX family transcriptional regulator C-terminal domain-containing protein [Streptomyces sp. NBC_01221]MCX4792326.1 PaaX family transcriptional regulator [Streptomyces sp. NBC_01221]